MPPDLSGWAALFVAVAGALGLRESLPVLAKIVAERKAAQDTANKDKRADAAALSAQQMEFMSRFQQQLLDTAATAQAALQAAQKEQLDMMRAEIAQLQEMNRKADQRVISMQSELMDVKSIAQRGRDEMEVIRQRIIAIHEFAILHYPEQWRAILIGANVPQDFAESLHSVVIVAPVPLKLPTPIAEEEPPT